MDASTSRREYYSTQLQAMGLKNKRIAAITPDSVLTREVEVDVEPKVPHTPKEISCVISHLIAIREAIYDKTLGPKNPFALITEDDVSYEMNVDFRALIASAPKPFAGLQLMSSAENEVKRLWQDYKKNPVPTNLWEQRKLESFFWSTQAYLINKTALRPLIDEIFSFAGSGAGNKPGAESSYDNLRVRLINPPKAYPSCKKGTKCYFPMRLVADTYIYALCYPTFVSKIPLFNGHSVGGNTTIHVRKQKDIAHAKAFLDIATVLAEVRKSAVLPAHISPKQCDLASA
jgi:GR25 family glycosyltransferase involved in LPS biosynthesis